MISDRTLTSVAECINSRLIAINADREMIEDIAIKAGYDKSTIISMFARGQAIVPLQKIPALARALGVSPRSLFRIAYQEYTDCASEDVDAILGRDLSVNEASWLDCIKLQTGEPDPECTKPRADALERALRDCLRF